MADRLGIVLEHVYRALPPAAGGPTDGQLLARFVATRDEPAFAALLRRHGPMVLAVCRRLLRHEQDAEDAFQATFLVLAHKAHAIRKRGSVGGWLHGVARHVAANLGKQAARRRARERQVEDMPHPEVAAPQPQDWRPLLDEELGRLPEKYRAALVLCDLEGQPRKEAARQLGVPEGTLSSRLVRARRMLAGRLARRGLALPAAAWAVALSQGAAAAHVPAGLLSSTVRAAALVAAGQLAAVSTPAAALTRGVLKAMFLMKLKGVTVAVLAAAALGAGGLAYRGGPGPAAAQAQPAAAQAPDTLAVKLPAAAKPKNELEALRRENELLKLNLEVVLEKVRAQEAELRALRGRPGAKGAAHSAPPDPLAGATRDPKAPEGVPGSPRLPRDRGVGATPDPVREVEAALQALRSARDLGSKRRAAEALERAMKKLRQGLDGGGGFPRAN
jgi:RNA polymerase sigma factor (sigma-70 family)